MTVDPAQAYISARGVASEMVAAIITNLQKKN